MRCVNPTFPGGFQRPPVLSHFLLDSSPQPDAEKANSGGPADSGSLLPGPDLPVPGNLPDPGSRLPAPGGPAFLPICRPVIFVLRGGGDRLLSH
eukprot:6334967-Heterocapsa_arctica.AAC.1